MKQQLPIPTSRIEAFSDGVIAIIITVMVFDLKLSAVPDDHNIGEELGKLMPKFVCYLLSFVMVAVMWVNHHQLMHQVRESDRSLLWYNILLLFWMSLVPFGTNLVGANPMLPIGACLYAAIFLMVALSFTLLRDYVVARKLLHETIQLAAQHRIRRKNRITMAIYATAAVSAFLSVYITFALLAAVPVMYFIPERIIHENN